jgi:hypothetical protein
MKHGSFGVAFGMSVLTDGWLRTFWMMACLFASVFIAGGAFIFFMMYIKFWFVSLILLGIAYWVWMSHDNFWWERWTGQYEDGLDVSFLVPPYVQDNLDAMSMGLPDYSEYVPRHSMRVDPFGNPL